MVTDQTSAHDPLSYLPQGVAFEDMAALRAEDPEGFTRRARESMAAHVTAMVGFLDAGAEEVNDLGESFEVVSEPTDLVAVRTALQDAGIDYESADAAILPSTEIDLDEEQARKVLKMIDALEDSDDVQDVYANYNVSDEIMEKLG